MLLSSYFDHVFPPAVHPFLMVLIIVDFREQLTLIHTAAAELCAVLPLHSLERLATWQPEPPEAR